MFDPVVLYQSEILISFSSMARFFSFAGLRLLVAEFVSRTKAKAPVCAWTSVSIKTIRGIGRSLKSLAKREDRKFVRNMYLIRYFNLKAQIGGRKLRPPPELEVFTLPALCFY